MPLSSSKTPLIPVDNSNKTICLRKAAFYTSATFFFTGFFMLVASIWTSSDKQENPRTLVLTFGGLLMMMTPVFYCCMYGEDQSADIVKQGEDFAILAFGSMVDTALEVGEAINATVVNMRSIKPLDETLLKQLAQTHRYFITLEENSIMDGAGSAIAEYFQSQHGDRQTCLQANGLTASSIITQIKTRWPLSQQGQGQGQNSDLEAGNFSKSSNNPFNSFNSLSR